MRGAVDAIYAQVRGRHDRCTTSAAPTKPGLRSAGDADCSKAAHISRERDSGPAGRATFASAAASALGVRLTTC